MGGGREVEGRKMEGREEGRGRIKGSKGRRVEGRRKGGGRE